MSRKYSALFLVATALLALSGCIIPKGYIDPTFRTASYRDVKPENEPVHVRIESSFTVNGKPVARAQDLVAKKVNRVIESTKIFLPDSQSASVLTVQIDNSADTGEAFSKGFATGFTFGLVGSHVVDRYKMRISYRYGQGEIFENSYDHALHSTIGLKSAPVGMEPVSYADALDQITEDMLLRFLVDFQKWKSARQTNPPADRKL